MKRPSFQFYPADWKGNAKLRRCSEAARGAWVDILCILHDSDEYGICRWPLDELARAAGVPMRLVKELIEKDVLKGAAAGKDCAAFIYTPRSGRKDGEPVTLIPTQPGPIWYSSRFVRDEYVRKHRGESSQFTEENNPRKGVKKASPKNAPKPPLGDGSTSPASPTVTEGKDKSSPSEQEAAHRLPHTNIPGEWAQWAKDALGWSDEVISDVWANFYDYWTDKKGKGARKTKWDATWRMWCRSERIPSNGGKNAHQPGTATGYRPNKTERAREAARRGHAKAGGFAERSEGQGETLEHPPRLL